MKIWDLRKRNIEYTIPAHTNLVSNVKFDWSGEFVITSSYDTTGALNHIGVTVDDLDAAETLVKAQGFTPVNHADYEPGRRFYFRDHDGVEYELVQYDD